MARMLIDLGPFPLGRAGAHGLWTRYVTGTAGGSPAITRVCGGLAWALPLTGRRCSVAAVGGSDALLAARLAAGDDHALAEVFDCLAAAVYDGAVRVLRDAAAAQDVVQDVFVELWSRPGRYDPAAGTLRAYLVMRARHRAVDLVRSELRRVARQEHSYRLAPGQPAPWTSEGVMAP